VVARLETAARQAAESEEFKQASEKLGFNPAFLPHEEFGKLVAQDDQQISKLMGDLGLKK